MSDDKLKGPVGAIMKEQTHIPPDIKITRCPPSRRGIPRNSNARPRKGGRVLSWSVAEALAPEATLPYEEQSANQDVKITRVIPALAEDDSE